MKRFMRFGWACLVMVALPMAGCFGGFSSKKAEDQVPVYHVWDSLAAYGGEEQGYALYTYVITDGNTNTRTDGGKRNQALLKAIVEPVANKGEAVQKPGAPAAVPRQQFNVFYIPLTQKAFPQFSSPLALYNLPLAQQVVAGLVRSMQDGAEISRNLLYSTPFLVSVPVPVPALDYRPTKVIIIDLSSTDPDDMNQIVAAFRQKQDTNVVNDLDRFRLVRLALYGDILPAQKITIAVSNPAGALPADGYRYRDGY